MKEPNAVINMNPESLGDEGSSLVDDDSLDGDHDADVSKKAKKTLAAPEVRAAPRCCCCGCSESRMSAGFVCQETEIGGALVPPKNSST